MSELHVGDAAEFLRCAPDGAAEGKNHCRGGRVGEKFRLGLITTQRCCALHAELTPRASPAESYDCVIVDVSAESPETSGDDPWQLELPPQSFIEKARTRRIIDSNHRFELA